MNAIQIVGKPAAPLQVEIIAAAVMLEEKAEGEVIVLPRAIAPVWVEILRTGEWRS